MELHAELSHRVFLRHAQGFHPFEGTGLFERIGGQASVERLVDALYDRFEADGELRPLFVRDLTRERRNQKRFFAEWLGGPRENSEHSYSVLQHQHDDLPITRALAGRWLGHFQHALAASVNGEAERAAVFEQARALAFAFVNRDAESAAAEGAEVGWCGVEARVLTRAATAAQRGNLTSLASDLASSPELVRRPTHAAKLLQAAVLGGRADSVELLLARGVDVDKPHYLLTELAGSAFERVLFATPLCVARLKRKTALESLLCEHGAKTDIFTAALLGDTTDLGQRLAAHPELAQAGDPATDALEITPLHHAVAGDHTDAARALLACTRGPLKAGGRALRGAAARENVELVRLLLERGASAAAIGAGRWVLHPELAPLLSAHGAALDSSADWIRQSCTGNQGRKDDPDYVRALLRHGARADDRRGGATALHYLAKAGFLRSIQVVLEHGGDPQARDDQGRTPLDWLEQAAKSVDRAAVRRLLS